MFWIWYHWMVFAEPHNLEEDNDTIKLNEYSTDMWRATPEKYQGMAVVIAVLQENP